MSVMSVMSDEQLIVTERRGRVLVATINRPAKANALSTAVIEAIGELVDSVAAQAGTTAGQAAGTTAQAGTTAAQVGTARQANTAAEASSTAAPRALVLTGAGTAAFSAGADIANLQGLTEATARDQMLRGQQVFDRLARLPVVSIAAIGGVALGGGLELAMACDLRIASPTARLGQPEITLGNIPGWGGTQRLPRLVGRGIATELITTGEMIDAARALAIGLVNHVADDPLAKALEIAEVIASRSPHALAAAKRVIDIGLTAGLAAGLTAEAEAVGALCQTEEQHEAVAAFLQRKAHKARV